jgi:hypothetical protein
MLRRSRHSMSLTIASMAASAFAFATVAFGEAQLSEPVYRVANEQAANAGGANLAVTNVAATVPAEAGPVFDLTQQPGEHPLAPSVRVLKATLEHIDRNIHDYSATLVKQERLDGELGEHQHILLKVRHEPFSVYMSFLKPFQGREVLYVHGQNNNEMVVLEAGFKRVLGKMNLAPDGMVAMRGQKHPITRVGIRNLTAELLKKCEADLQYAECEVVTRNDTKINGRPTTMVQVVHPIPRQNFYAHVTRIFLDNELRVPIHYDAYMWPAQPGGEPPLEECYTYTNMKVNNGYTARDFDASNNPEIFKQ